MLSKIQAKLKNRKKGFSMVEMGIVIALIIIMGTFLFVKGGEIQQSRKLAQVSNDMDAIATGALMYESFHINSQLPGTLVDLADGLDAAESIDGMAHKNIVSSSKVTTSDAGAFVDPWGTAYEYDATERTLKCTPKDASGASQKEIVRHF